MRVAFAQPFDYQSHVQSVRNTAYQLYAQAQSSDYHAAARDACYRAASDLLGGGLLERAKAVEISTRRALEKQLVSAGKSAMDAGWIASCVVSHESQEQCAALRYHEVPAFESRDDGEGQPFRHEALGDLVGMGGIAAWIDANRVK